MFFCSIACYNLFNDNKNGNMIKKVNLLILFFFIFIISFATKENYQQFNYFNFLVNYPIPVTNGLAGLGAGFLTFKLLNKKNYFFLKRFPSMERLAYGISAIFPFLITALRAKKLYNSLNYKYIIKNFDLINRHDYWFDKSAMINDYKINLLDKSQFEKDSVSDYKYKVLLDILTKPSNKIIDELKEYDQQEDFLSAVLLLDAEKSDDLKLEYLKNIKETFKETSVLKKKLSNSVFFNNSETINDFLNKVKPQIAARFIVEYKDDMQNLLKHLVRIDSQKIKDIFSAGWKTGGEQKFTESKKPEQPWKKKSTDNNKKLMKPIISGPILFDLIVNLYDDQKEFCLTLFINLSDQCFLNLITYVYYNEKSIHQNDQLNFFSLIKFLQNKYNNSFLRKCKILETNESVLRWWLDKAGIEKNQSQETKLTVNLPEKPKDNNNSQTSQNRLEQFSSIISMN